MEIPGLISPQVQAAHLLIAQQDRDQSLVAGILLMMDKHMAIRVVISDLSHLIYPLDSRASQALTSE